MNRTFSTFRKRREQKYGPADQTPSTPQNRLDRRPERAEPAASDQAAPGPAPDDQPVASTDGRPNDTAADRIATDNAAADAAGPTAPITASTAPDAEVEPEADVTPPAGDTEAPEAQTPEVEASEPEATEAGTPETDVPDDVPDDVAAEDMAAEDVAVAETAEPVSTTPEVTDAEVTGADALESEAPEADVPDSPATESPDAESADIEPAADQTVADETPAMETPAEASVAETPAVEVSEPKSPEPPAEAPNSPVATEETESSPVAAESTPSPHRGFSEAETTRFAAVPPTPVAPVAPAGSPADDNETERINTGSEATTERINIGKAAAPKSAPRPAAQASPVGNWKAEPATPQYIPAGGGNPQQRPPQNKPKKSRKGLWTSLVALVAIIVAAVVVVALVAGSSEESVAPADVAADRALEYVTALQDGNIVVLRSITCGEALERFTTMSDQEFAEDHQIQKANNELVGVDGVKASKIIDDGDAAVVEVIAYKTATPDEKLDVALTLSKVDGEWKVCKA